MCFAAICCIRDVFLNINVNLATYNSLKLLGEWALTLSDDQKELCLAGCFFVTQSVYSYIDGSGGMFAVDDSCKDELEDIEYFCEEFSKTDRAKLKQRFQEDIIDKWNRNIPVILKDMPRKYEIRVQTVQGSLCWVKKTFQIRYNIYADEIFNTKENEGDDNIDDN